MRPPRYFRVSQSLQSSCSSVAMTASGLAVARDARQWRGPVAAWRQVWRECDITDLFAEPPPPAISRSQWTTYGTAMLTNRGGESPRLLTIPLRDHPGAQQSSALRKR